MTKYHNQKTGKYDSKREAQHAAELKIRERLGEISNLREQVRFELLPSLLKSDGKKERPVHYVADFTYEENTQLVVVDVKGMKTRDYIIKRKMMLFRHGITIKEV